LSAIYCTPGPLNSNLIKTEKAVPNSPENNANIRYNVPISFAFEDKNHLSIQSEILDFKLSWIAICSTLMFCFVILYETNDEFIWEFVINCIINTMLYI
jgi:hypothetical protein